MIIIFIGNYNMFIEGSHSVLMLTKRDFEEKLYHISFFCVVCFCALFVFGLCIVFNVVSVSELSIVDCLFRFSLTFIWSLFFVLPYYVSLRS